MDIPSKVFPARENLRKILAEPLAGAFYMQFGLRPFVERYSLQAVLAHVRNPPQEVLAATERFLREAQTGVPQSLASGSAEGNELATVVHAAFLKMKVNPT